MFFFLLFSFACFLVAEHFAFLRMEIHNYVFNYVFNMSFVGEAASVRNLALGLYVLGWLCIP